MLAILALSIWLVAFGVFVASFVPLLATHLLPFSAELFVVGVFVVVILGKRALNASIPDGVGALKFYRNIPKWTWAVQILLILVLWAVLFVSPTGREINGKCAPGYSVWGARVELTLVECNALRLGNLRGTMAALMVFGWFAVAQFALSRKNARIES